MIRPAPGVAFTWRPEGDQRGDPAARNRAAASLGIPPEWAIAAQVHGTRVHVVDSSGHVGDGDGLVVQRHSLPVAVFTADCLGIVMTAPGAVGVAHAGWRGLADGVLEATRETMTRQGSPPSAAYIGPGIGPCCFEVGPEVLARFPADTARTTWNTPSVDLVGDARRRLDGLEVWADRRCTRCEGGYSHRRTGGPERMAAIGWLP